MSAAQLYEQLTSDRSSALHMAREASRLTIPSLVPPEGTNSNTPLPSPYQSLGAYGVNNLAAKLLMALYPQGTSFFRYVIPEQIAAASQVPPEGRQEILKALSSIENRALQKFETSIIRPQKAEALMHLVVAGNVLTYFPDMEEFRLFRIDQYVVRRDASGKPMDVVVHEKVNPRGLSDDVKAACGVRADDKEAVSVYTWATWEDGRCRWHQEINNKSVPDSEGDAPADLAPWNPLRWKAVPGSDYGRGHCEEYLGDLISLEGLSQSIVEFSAAAAKIVLLVNPGAQTDIQDVNKARSGEAVAGVLDDIGVLQLDKYADFQVAQAVSKGIEERLSRAFLLRSGLVRDAERVTAEEIRGTAQELEDTLGGVYTILAQEEQFPFVRRLLHVLTRSAVIPRLPSGVAEPVIVTGFQALGRNHELNRLRGLLADIQQTFGPEAALQLLHGSDVVARMAAGWGVEGAASLIKSREELAAERAAAEEAEMMKTMVDKGTAPAVAGAMESGGTPQ